MAPVEVFLVAKRVSQVVADAGFLWIEPLGGTIFLDRLIQLPLIVQHHAQVAVRLPEVGTQTERVPIGDGRSPQISLIAVGDSHVEVNVGVRQRAFRFARERFLEGVQRGIVVAIGVKRKPKIAIGLGVGRIHTERRARFGERVARIIITVKQIGELAVRFGETRHQPRRFRKFIERVVEPLLPPQQGSQDKMQQSITRIPSRSIARTLLSAASKSLPCTRAATCASALEHRQEASTPGFRLELRSKFRRTKLWIKPESAPAFCSPRMHCVVARQGRPRAEPSDSFGLCARR